MEPEKGSQLHDMQMPQEKGRAVTPKEAQQEPTPHPTGGEEEDSSAATEKIDRRS